MNHSFSFQHLPRTDLQVINIGLLTLFDPEGFKEDDQYYEELRSISPLPIYVEEYRNFSCTQFDYKIVGGGHFYRAVCALPRSPVRLQVYLCKEGLPKDIIIPSVEDFVMSRPGVSSLLTPKKKYRKWKVRKTKVPKIQPDEHVRPRDEPKTPSQNVDLDKVQTELQKLQKVQLKKPADSMTPGVLQGKIDMAKVREAARKLALREADPITHWTDLIPDSERPERTVTNPGATWN